MRLFRLSLLRSRSSRARPPIRGTARCRCVSRAGLTDRPGQDAVRVGSRDRPERSESSISRRRARARLARPQDAVLGNEPKVALEVYGPRIQVLRRSACRRRVGGARRRRRLRRVGRGAGRAARRRAQRHGRVVIPITEGTGANPTAASTVRVHYHGTLRDGTVFDSSVERSEPISFPLSGVIPCWTEGVQKIKVGGKVEAALPVRDGVRRSRLGLDPGRRRARVRGRAARDRVTPGQTSSAWISRSLPLTTVALSTPIRINSFCPADSFSSRSSA